MSRTVSRGQKADALVAEDARASRGRRRGGWVVAGLVVVVLAAEVVSAGRAGVFSPAGSSRSGQQGAPAAATAVVARRDITATMPVSATLGLSLIHI